MSEIKYEVFRKRLMDIRRHAYSYPVLSNNRLFWFGVYREYGEQHKWGEFLDIEGRRRTND